VERGVAKVEKEVRQAARAKQEAAKVEVVNQLATKLEEMGVAREGSEELLTLYKRINKFIFIGFNITVLFS
jgi:hypothetical protein